jgi:hypothetical protein
LRVNGYELGLEPSKIAGFMITSEGDHELFLRYWARTGEDCMPAQLKGAYDPSNCDLSRRDSRQLVRAFSGELAVSRGIDPIAGQEGLARIINTIEGTSEVVEGHLRHFTKPGMEPVDEARAILQGCERLMRRPDFLTHPHHGLRPA